MHRTRRLGKQPGERPLIDPGAEAYPRRSSLRRAPLRTTAVPSERARARQERGCPAAVRLLIASSGIPALEAVVFTRPSAVCVGVRARAALRILDRWVRAGVARRRRSVVRLRSAGALRWIAPEPDVSVDWSPAWDEESGVGETAPPQATRTKEGKEEGAREVHRDGRRARRAPADGAPR